MKRPAGTAVVVTALLLLHHARTEELCSLLGPDASRSEISGPGLSKVAQPDRWFELVLRNEDGAAVDLEKPAWQSVNEELKDRDVIIEIKVDDKVVEFRTYYVGRGVVRVIYGINRGRGHRVDISCKVREQHTIGSPVLIQEAHHFMCRNPVELSHFVEGLQCPAEQQLEDDLKRWPNVTKEHRDRALKEAHQVHYAFINQTLYSKVVGTIVDIRTLVEPFFLALARMVKLPDVEFTLNFSDYPASASHKPAAAFFSGCTTSKHHDVHIPTYDAMLSALQRKHDMVRPCNHGYGPPWAQRKDKLVWRGSDSNRLRFAFNKYCAEHNDTGYFDVGLSHTVREKHNLDKHGPVVGKMGFCEYFHNK